MRTLTKITIGTAVLTALTACAPQVKYLNEQSTRKTNCETPSESQIRGLNGLKVAPKQINYLNGESTNKNDYQTEILRERKINGLNGREVYEEEK